MYQVNEIFYSLQGEGARVGTANVFVRFSGCNLKCMRATHGFDCDTEFVSGRRVSLDDLLLECRERGGACRSVIFTGGEPSLQLDDDLVGRFKEDGWFIAVESNGTRALPVGIDYVVVSPKTAEHTLVDQVVHELRYVRAAGQSVPRPRLEAEHYCVSPVFESDGTVSAGALSTCIEICREDPRWRLSVQQHKIWAIR